MKLHAGSLYKNYLVLYGENQTPHCITVSDEKLQWEIYCNDVEISESKVAGYFDVVFDGETHSLPGFKSDNPMKALGWLK